MKNKLRVFTKKHRENISNACMGRVGVWKGKKMPKASLYKNMVSHLKYDVSLEWLKTFDDIEKLKCLNSAIKRKRDSEGFTTEIYKLYIERFYNDKKFNELFKKWKDTGDKWIKPSLDHIVPKAGGGNLLLQNLQFISWLENRAKIDIKQEEWNKIKKNIRYFL